MANLYGRDAFGADAYLRSTGTGTNADPFIVSHDVFSAEVKSAFVATSGNADLVAAVSNKKIRILALAITASDACTLKFQSGANSDITPPWHIAPSGNLTIASELGLMEGATGEKINTVVSGSANYTAFVSYREV